MAGQVITDVEMLDPEPYEACREKCPATLERLDRRMLFLTRTKMDQIRSPQGSWTRRHHRQPRPVDHRALSELTLRNTRLVRNICV